MKALCAFVVCVLLLTSPVHVGQTADALDNLFARAKAAQAAIKTLSAAFTETTVSSLLRDPVIAEGTLIAVLPVRVVMTYASPVAKTVALDSTRLVVAWTARPQREEINIAETQHRVQQYFVDASPKQLRDSFTITLSTDAANHEAHRLDMVPRRKQIAEGLDRLRIWIDPVRLLMIKMTLEYRGGDRKTFELRDIQTNVPIDESAFALLAKGR